MGAPLNPVPNCLRITFGGPYGPYPWTNVLHWEYSGTAPSNGTCANIATTAAASWGTHMSPEQPSPIVLNKVVVTDLTSVTSGEGEWIGDVPGTRGDDTIGANSCMLVTYPATYRYKGGHPRSYLAIGGNADNADAAHWSTAFVEESKTHFDAFLAAITGYSTSGTTLTQQVAVRYRGKFLPNGGPPHYYLTTPLVLTIAAGQTVTQAQMASQRRRIGRVRK